MDRESVERLRFDRRLQRRKGWIEPGALEEYVDSLPDVSDKLTRGQEEEADEPAASAPSTPPQPDLPNPLASFGSGGTGNAGPDSDRGPGA